jgi:hypothetical protein
MPGNLNPSEEAQLQQTIEMFEVITQSQPNDYQSLEILKEAYAKLGRERDVVGTSKRVAQAYVLLGQLSSAILEYESILQRHPNDPDVMKALEDIEKSATGLAGSAPMPEMDLTSKAAPAQTRAGGSAPILDLDDGRSAMEKIFVAGKMVSAGDFNLCWNTPNADDPAEPIEPFVQLLADKSILPLEAGLRVLCEKTRLGFMPLEKYDVDVEVTRVFPKEVLRRWCVVPFDKLSKIIMVATANPFNKAAAAELERTTKSRIVWYIAPPPDMVKVLKKIYR